jgi:hypothetical protein
MGAQREQRVRVGWAQRPLLPRDQLDHDFGLSSPPGSLSGCGSDVWAASPFGTVFRIQGSQLVETLSYDGTAHGIWAASPNHIVVVGVAGTIARSLE